MTGFMTSVLLLVIGADTLGPGDYQRTVKVGELQRSYHIHVPPKYDSKKPAPLILAFHGGGGNAEVMMSFCQLNKKSDEEGFIVVYPNGTGRLERVLTFNAGNCCGYAMTNNVDDVEFTRQLLNQVEKSVSVDPKRIFATGMSNGGMMAYLLASELSDRIAAVAPVSATMGTTACHPKRPVSVIHFHGTADDNIPIHGGKGKGISGTDFLSVDHSIEAWVKANGCDKNPTVVALPDRSNDGMSITSKTYGSGKDGAEVVLIEIDGGGHTWPGQETRLKLLGKTTKDISANDLMWEFFKKHPMK